MALSDIVNLNITTTSQAISRPGFGTLLVFAPTPYSSNLVRAYSGTSAMISDGFVATDAAYVAASAVFSQNPHTPIVKIGKCTALPTQSFQLTATVANATVYSFLLCTPAVPQGVLCTYTSSGSATMAAINAGLIAAVTASGLAVVASDQTTYLRVQASAAGTVFGVAAPSVSLAVFDASADNTFAAQLAAIFAEDPNWYGLASVYNSAAQTQIIGAFAEANQKLFMASSRDTGVVTAGGGDIASLLQAASRRRTAGLQCHNQMEFGQCAWFGLKGAADPGSETWKFATLAGPTVSALSQTQNTTAAGKNWNTYTTLASQNFTAEGKVSSGEFIDVVRFIDWLYNNLQLDIFALLKNAAGKVPYTDAGAVLLDATIRARLQQGVQAGGLVAGSIVVTVPKVATQLASDRGNRYFPGITFSANLAGAIHSLAINGTVSI